ncbi:MAG: J domain-containing protein [Candidatus Microthrix parvicella]
MQTVGVDPYRVLGVGRTADDQAVRGRYLALVERDRPANYPDSADFTPQRTRAAATVSILNEAYRLIRNERGWS